MELDIKAYKLKIGDKAIDFNLKGTDEKLHSLKDFNGKKAIAVIFTCNHCPYARAYEERLVTLQKDFADKNVAFVAINANDSMNYPQDSFDNMRVRAKEKNFNFPYLHDPAQETAHSYGAQVTPEIFLFNSELRLAYHGHIDNDMDNPKAAIPALKHAIEATISGKDSAVKETSAFGCSIKWK